MHRILNQQMIGPIIFAALFILFFLISLRFPSLPPGITIYDLLGLQSVEHSKYIISCVNGVIYSLIFGILYYIAKLSGKRDKAKLQPTSAPTLVGRAHIEKVEELLPWIDVLNPLDRVKVILETTDATKSSILTKKIQEISANNWNLQSSCVIYQTEDIKNMKEKAQKHQTPKQLLKEYCREKNITEKLLILGEKLVGKADETKDINTSEL